MNENFDAAMGKVGFRGFPVQVMKDKGLGLYLRKYSNSVEVAVTSRKEEINNTYWMNWVLKLLLSPLIAELLYHILEVGGCSHE